MGDSGIGEEQEMKAGRKIMATITIPEIGRYRKALLCQLTCTTR